MVSLLLHVHKNISVTDIACSWSEKCAKENEEVMTIDDMCSNNFKAVTDTHNIDFKASCFDKSSTANQTVGFSWLLSLEPLVEDFSEILLLENIINSSEFRTSKNSIQMLFELCKLSFEEIKDIASKWCLYRKFRLTSSNFHKVIKSVKNNQYPNSLYKFQNEDLKIALTNSNDYIINFDKNKNAMVLF